MTSRALRYPLQTEALTAGLMFYVVLSIFFAAYRFSVWLNVLMLVLWLVFCSLLTLRFMGMLFEYGMDILLATAHGAEAPPAASSKLAMPRVRSLLLVLAFWIALSQLLATINPLLAIPTSALIGALVPAFIINNTLFSAEAMLNPASVALTIRRLGWTYVQRSLLLVPMVLLFIVCITGSLLNFMLVLPVFLYCTFQFFHQLGLAVRPHIDIFLPLADFRADRRELEAVRVSLADINQELSAAYELLRAGEEPRVLQQIDALVRRKGWGIFEQLFRYVAEWPYPAPALHLCRDYLNQPESLAAPMRALELAQWTLQRDADFTLPSSHLQILAEQAVIVTQYRSVLQLIENHLVRFPDSPQREQLLNTALELAAHKIKDEQRFAHLKAIGSGAALR